MDDFPASPACPELRRPPLSVVIPVCNGGAAFERCLRGLRESNVRDYELVVVDDGSTDSSATLAMLHGARLIRHSQPLGPAAARNAGARAATSSLVFFFDADVVPHPDTMRRALTHLERNPALSALFGSYDDRPEAPGLVSQFRNLLHHFVHQTGEFQSDSRPAHTFWTGCGLIRRSVFLDLGGFDPELYRRPAIEDIEFGYRLSQAGHQTILARDVQVTHLKRWTLRSMISTDVFCRGVPWMVLMLRSHVVEQDLNVSRGQRACVAATALGLAGLAVSPIAPAGLLFLALNLLLIVALNRPFYTFLKRLRGTGFAAASLPLHYIYYLCCGVSVLIALGVSLSMRRSTDHTTTSGFPRPVWFRRSTLRAGGRRAPVTMRDEDA